MRAHEGKQFVRFACLIAGNRGSNNLNLTAELYPVAPQTLGKVRCPTHYHIHVALLL